MLSVPLIDLRAQYRALKPEIDRAIHRVLDRGQFILGEEGDALERELAAYCGTRHAVALASGTDALELSLRACSIGPGDEVITSALTFFATAEAILAAGATPVFVDVEPAAYTLDPAAVEAAVTRATRAIIPVHLYGHPCAMDALLRIARAHRLKVIEDCAQAIGAAFRGRRVGSFGTAGCLSFYPSKNLGAYGDGGMVVTNDAALAKRLRLLRTHGGLARYRHLIVGTNSRLDEIQAAVLRVKLRYLNRWNEARRRHARRYDEAFRRRGLTQIVRPRARPSAEHVYHLYCIRVAKRDRLAAALAKQGIGTQVAYPSTVPSQPALRFLRQSRRSFPNAQAAASSLLALPMYPELTPALIARVTEAVARATPPVKP